MSIEVGILKHDGAMVNKKQPQKSTAIFLGIAKFNIIKTTL